MRDMRWPPRAVAALTVLGILAVAFAIRALTGTDAAFAQHSGTALYASMIYAGVFVLVPAARPVTAGAVAVLFCWAVELFQLTGVPADLSGRSILARLALGVAYDPVDMAWYPMGVLPLAAVHHVLLRRAALSTAVDHGGTG